MLTSQLSPSHFLLLALGLWAGGLWLFNRHRWPPRVSGGVLLLGATWLSIFLVASLLLHLVAQGNQRSLAH